MLVGGEAGGCTGEGTAPGEEEPRPLKFPGEDDFFFFLFGTSHRSSSFRLLEVGS